MEAFELYPPQLSGDAFSRLRENPDRGWRLETYITLGSNTVMFHKGISPTAYLDGELEHYREVPLHLIQVYVYLTEYCKKPLDAAAFTQLQAYLEALQSRGLRAVLRFAYEFEVNRKTGPTTRRICGHLRQIGGWFQAHQALVNDTVAVWQAGMIGAWGEWHTAKFYHSKKKVLRALCAAALPDMPLQVRRQQFKDCMQNTPQAAKIGYHDDFLVGDYHKWNVPDGAPETKRYAAFVKESRFTYNDGEMPWGRDKTVRNGFIDGCEMLQSCAEHSLSTLSLTHNYTEENGQYNALRWQTETLDFACAKRLGCPCSAAYFQAQGEPVVRTVFDFLTDHLGYQLAVQRIAVQAGNTDGAATVTVSLENNGFALPYGFTRLSLWVQGKDGTVKEYPFTDYAPSALVGGERRDFCVSIAAQAIEKIGVSLSKPTPQPRFVRFANQSTYRDGINWFAAE